MTQIGVLTVSPSGALDIATAAGLRSTIRAAAARGPARLVVDLGQLNFIDCSGLSVLLWGLTHCENSGVSLLIGNPARCVRYLVEVTGTAARLGVDPAASFEPARLDARPTGLGQT